MSLRVECGPSKPEWLLQWSPGARESDEVDECCRICYGAGELFSPCLCRGSMGLVHPACLQLWRQTGTNPTAATTCSNCHFTYHTRKNPSAAQARALLVGGVGCLLALAEPWLVPHSVSSYVLGILHWELLQGPIRPVGFALASLIVFGVLSAIRASVGDAPSLAASAYAGVALWWILCVSTGRLAGLAVVASVELVVVPVAKRLAATCGPWLDDDVVLAM